MKSILILSEYFPDTARPSCGIFILQQAKELAKLAKVTVIAPIASPLPRKKFRSIREINSHIPYSGTLKGVSFFRPRYFDWPRFSNYLNAYGMLLAIWAHIRRNKLTVDLIHAHFAHSMGYVGALLAGWLNTTFIVTIHGFDMNIRPSFVPDRQRIKVALHKANRIIAVSNSLKKVALEMGISEEKVATIYNGIDVHTFKPMDKGKARKKLGLPFTKQIVLYVGNLNEVKGVHYLIKAFSRLCAHNSFFYLVIVGDGPERNILEKEVNDLGLRDVVIFAGARANAEVPLWMNACDAFVLPSTSEGFGIVLLEALACGKPVVATKVGGIPEIVSDPSLGILVEPANASQLASAISDACNREWNADVLINHARKYTWEQAASRIYKQYELIG